MLYIRKCFNLLWQMVLIAKVTNLVQELLILFEVYRVFFESILSDDS